jgi:hypothetical protein
VWQIAQSACEVGEGSTSSEILSTRLKNRKTNARMFLVEKDGDDPAMVLVPTGRAFL